MRIIIFPIIIAIQLICQVGLVYGGDLYTHHAYKVTSYNLGVFQGFQNNGAGNVSRDFKPLLITNTTSDILNSEHQRTVSFGETAPRRSSISGIALSAQFDATNNIAIQGAFGLTRNLWTPELGSNVSGSSWEADLGIVYKLLNNLSYELHFGYMDTGNLFTDRSSYTDVESIIMISNQLTLSF